MGQSGSTEDPWSGMFSLILLMDKIRRSPVDMVILSHDIQGFVNPRWLGMGFLNHQQLHLKKTQLIFQTVLVRTRVSFFWKANCGMFVART